VTNSTQKFLDIERKNGYDKPMRSSTKTAPRIYKDLDALYRRFLRQADAIDSNGDIFDENDFLSILYKAATKIEDEITGKLTARDK
jgi:hypothetical protein